MKTILFVMNTMGRAGAERALIALMNALPREEYQISLLSLVNRGEMFQEVPEHVHILNKHPKARSVLSPGGQLALIGTTAKCFFYRLRGFSLLGYLIRNLRMQMKDKIRLDKLLWRVISRGTPAPDQEYDLAVAYLEGASTYFVADAVRARKKASFVHIDYQKAGYNASLDLDAYDQIDRIFSVSEEAGESFLRVYPKHREKLALFRNIIDVDRIRELSRDDIPADSPFLASRATYKLLTVGRLNYQKGYDIAIPALGLLRDRGVDVDWFILGEGSLERELRAQIRDAGLEGHFILLGSKQNPYPYIRKADLYIHATRFEGKSIAIEEAQVLGKAIIASDCTGNREQIVPGENGILIPLSAENIADSIEELLQQPERIKAFEEASAAKDLRHQKDMDAFLALLKT